MKNQLRVAENSGLRVVLRITAWRPALPIRRGGRICFIHDAACYVTDPGKFSLSAPFRRKNNPEAAVLYLKDIAATVLTKFYIWAMKRVRNGHSRFVNAFKLTDSRWSSSRDFFTTTCERALRENALALLSYRASPPWAGWFSGVEPEAAPPWSIPFRDGIRYVADK